MGSLNQAMNNIVSENEIEGGLAFEDENVNGNEDGIFVCYAKLCLVGKFLIEGVMNF